MKAYPSLTAVCHAAIQTSAVDRQTVADMLGMQYCTLSSELCNQERHKLGADLLLPIMDITGNHAPMHFLARELGGIYVQMPKQAGVAPLTETLLASVKEFGEYAAEAAKDVADGYLPRDQYDRIQKEGQEALAAILKMLEVARAVHQEQYGPSR